MAVFSLPSYQTVFKIIKDRFAPQKNITAEEVKEKYHIVKRHDRVGRMADTQEFQNLILPRERFSADLIEELERQAASSVEITDRYVKIRHVYTERLMTPLNMFIDDADEEAVREWSSSANQRSQSVSRCRRCAALRIVCSSNGLPISCSPTGMPLMKPAGVDKPGRPARFTASV